MAEQLEVAKRHINEFLHKYPDVEAHVDKAAAKIGTDKAFVVMGAIAIPVLLLLAMGSTGLLVDAVGYGYPLYMTLKALESPGPEDDKQWLTYWLLFSAFKVVESLVGWLLELIPFYFVIKIALLVWCYYPSTMGATTIYNAAVKPYIIPAMGLSKGEVEGLSEKPTTYKLVCSLEEVTFTADVNSSTDSETDSNNETSIQCCVSLLPPPERAADKNAMEGVHHTSQTMIIQRASASPVHFKAQMTPLTRLDGSLKIEIYEKSTFGSSSAAKKFLGVLELPVSMISLKERTTYTELECIGCDFPGGKCLVHMTLDLTAN